MSVYLIVFRLIFDPRQIHHAAQHPVNLDQAQADAVEARTVLDLKIGAAFTRMQTMVLQQRIAKIRDEKSVLSYGKLFVCLFRISLTRYG